MNYKQNFEKFAENELKNDELQEFDNLQNYNINGNLNKKIIKKHCKLNQIKFNPKLFFL